MVASEGASQDINIQRSLKDVNKSIHIDEFSSPESVQDLCVLLLCCVVLY